MSTINKLQSEVARLKEELRNAENDLRRAVIAESGFHEGEVVEARKNYGRVKEFRPAIIRNIYVSWDSRLRFVVSFAKKDGNWSAVRVDYALVRKPGTEDEGKGAGY
jgi:hypothetical protein